MRIQPVLREFLPIYVPLLQLLSLSRPDSDSQKPFLPKQAKDEVLPHRISHRSHHPHCFLKGEPLQLRTRSMQCSRSRDSRHISKPSLDHRQKVTLSLTLSLISAFSLTIYILLALSSCVYAYRRLTRPGMSEEIRMMFIRKHISYVTTFIIIWTFYLAS